MKQQKKTTYKKINYNDKASIKLKITTNHPGILYNYMSCEKFKKVDILLNGKSIIDINDENGYECNILELGKYGVGEEIELQFELLEDRIEPKDIMFYTLDLEKFEQAINKITDKLEITEYKNDYIKTKINVTNNEILYTSIPYDKGFEIKVDGNKIEPIQISDTLTGIELQKGEHTIEFKYIPRGFKAGTIISLTGILLFIITKKKKTD